MSFGKRQAGAVAVLCGLVAGAAEASCGSAFCVLNTDWDVHGLHSQAGKTTLDVHYEYLKQDRLRAGGQSISAAAAGEDPAELQTVNRNLTTTLDHALDAHWGVSVALPVVDRSHRHIEDPSGAADAESWHFSRPGDARLLGRYQVSDGRRQHSYGLQFGVKLPTGEYRLGNSQGVTAERALQPGTGSTDAIAGMYYSFHPTWRGLSGFVQAQYQFAVASKDGYRPGDQWTVNGGVAIPVATKLQALLQMNLQAKQRDSGANAEPDLSGGDFAFISPGLSYAATPALRVYGYFQQPLYRRVNGVQLSADEAWLGGVALRF